MTYDEERLVRLLKIIQDLALIPYPFRDDEGGDPVLALALGQIAGTAMSALRDHKSRSKTKAEDDAA